MSVKDKMTSISDAIRNLTLETAVLGLDEMIADTAEIMDYDLSEVEGHLSEMTLDEKLTVMADVIRYGTGLTKRLSLDDMADAITAFPTVAISNGKAFYDNLADAIAECDDGGTVTLFRDIDVGNLSNVSVDKSITLDGRNHTITRKTGSDTLFVITKDGVTFNIQSVIADVSLGSEECFLYGNNITADVNISDSDITATEIVLFLRYATCNVTVNSSTLNAGLRNIQFNYCSGNVEVNNSNLYGGRSDANAFLIFDSEVDVCIKSSNLYGRNSPALSVRYSDISVLIDHSYVQADNTLYGAIDVHNCSPLIDLKNSTTIWIDSLTNASIRMRGSSNCDPTITLYDSVVLTEGLEGHIYYTTYGERTGFHVRFATDYSGPAFTAMSTWDSSKNCVLALRYSLPEAAESYSYVLVNRDVDYTAPIVFENHVTYVQSAVTIDIETGYETSKPRRIYYNGDGSMFYLQYYDDPDYANYFTHLELNDLYLLADHGTVFYFGSGKIHTLTRNCVVEGQKVLTGFTSEDIFITYDVTTRDALVAEGHYVEEIYDPNSVLYYSATV